VMHVPDAGWNVPSTIRERAANMIECLKY